MVPEVCRDLTGWLPEFHENSVRARSGRPAVDRRDMKTAVWTAGWLLLLTGKSPRLGATYVTSNAFTDAGQISSSGVRRRPDS